jgi:hypothetical protein
LKYIVGLHKKSLNPFAKVLKKFSKVLKKCKMEMRALWCKSLFSLFFRFISRYLENGHEKGMSIFENPKRELKKM